MQDVSALSRWASGLPLDWQAKGTPCDSFTDTESVKKSPQGGGRLRSEWVAGLRQNGWLTFRQNGWPPCARMGGRLGPDYAIRYRPVRSTDDILQHSAILLHRPNRFDIVIVAGHENPPYSQRVSRDLHGLPKDLSCKATPTEFGHNRIPDMAESLLQERSQQLWYRNPADDSRSNEREEKCGGNLGRVRLAPRACAVRTSRYRRNVIPSR
jgi:hypothetical protein